MTANTLEAVEALTHQELTVVSDILGRMETAAATGDMDLMKTAAGFALRPEFATALKKIDDAKIATRPRPALTFGEAHPDMDRAQRIAASQAYRIFRDGDGFCAVGASSAEDPRFALATSTDLHQVLNWILDGCSEETKAAAWEYIDGGGSGDDWKPFK